MQLLSVVCCILVGCIRYVESFKEGAMCEGYDHVQFRHVHIAKTGGSTLECSFSTRKGIVSSPTNCLNINKGMKFELKGLHENYQEVVGNIMKCDKVNDKVIYKSGGTNCHRKHDHICEPFITFLAHPADRFMSSFFQSFMTMTSIKPSCSMVACKPGSKVSDLYNKAQITPSQFALWQPKADIEDSFNVQVRYIGLETAVAHGKHDKLLSDNSTESNLILALAKERIQEMDFIGITSRFMDSLLVMSWKLGIPINDICSCNINPFKIKKDKWILHERAKIEVIKDNYLDMQLYEFALAKFEKDYSEFIQAMTSQQDKTLVEKTSKSEPKLSVESVDLKEFICQKDEMKCLGFKRKVSSRNHRWMESSEYRRIYLKKIEQGRANNCAFKCSREQNQTKQHP